MGVREDGFAGGAEEDVKRDWGHGCAAGGGACSVSASRMRAHRGPPSGPPSEVGPRHIMPWSPMGRRLQVTPLVYS